MGDGPTSRRVRSETSKLVSFPVSREAARLWMLGKLEDDQLTPDFHGEALYIAYLRGHHHLEQVLTTIELRPYAFIFYRATVPGLIAMTRKLGGVVGAEDDKDKEIRCVLSADSLRSGVSRLKRIFRKKNYERRNQNRDFHGDINEPS